MGSHQILSDASQVAAQMRNYATMLQIPTDAIAKEPSELEESIIKDHEEYLMSTRLENSPLDKRPGQARREVEVVKQLFPKVEDIPRKLALAAWFAWAIRVDDLVEAGSGSPEQGLLDAWNIFDEHVCPEPAQLTSDICRHSNHLRLRLRELLPEVDLPNTFRQVREVIMSLLEESIYRKSTIRDLETYISIRARTIALGPFFGILRIPTNRPRTEVERLATELREQVCLAVGLQNDIVGLPKDIQAQDEMNYAGIYFRSQANASETIGDQQSLSMLHGGMKDAVFRHNQAVERAETLFGELCKKGSVLERENAKVLYELLFNHLSWTLNSDRYKCAQNGITNGIPNVIPNGISNGIQKGVQNGVAIEV